jgi:hypothetical protein
MRKNKQKLAMSSLPKNNKTTKSPKNVFKFKPFKVKSVTDNKKYLKKHVENDIKVNTLDLKVSNELTFNNKTAKIKKSPQNTVSAYNTKTFQQKHIKQIDNTAYTIKSTKKLADHLPKPTNYNKGSVRFDKPMHIDSSKNPMSIKIDAKNGVRVTSLNPGRPTDSQKKVLEHTKNLLSNSMTVIPAKDSSSLTTKLPNKTLKTIHGTTNTNKSGVNEKKLDIFVKYKELVGEYLAAHTLVERNKSFDKLQSYETKYGIDHGISNSLNGKNGLANHISSIGYESVKENLIRENTISIVAAVIKDYNMDHPEESYLIGNAL